MILINAGCHLEKWGGPDSAMRHSIPHNNVLWNNNATVLTITFWKLPRGRAGQFIEGTHLSSTILICRWRFALRSRRVYCCWECGGGCAGHGGGGVGGGRASAGVRLPMSTFRSAMSFCTIRTRPNNTATRTLVYLNLQSITIGVPRAIGSVVASTHWYVTVARADKWSIDIDRGVVTSRVRNPHCRLASDYDLAAFYKCPMSAASGVCESQNKFRVYI